LTDARIERAALTAALFLSAGHGATGCRVPSLSLEFGKVDRLAVSR
jgi:hypothetical protein